MPRTTSRGANYGVAVAFAYPNHRFNPYYMYGTVADQTPPTPRTLFCTGSITKTLTTALFAKGVMTNPGCFDWDAGLQRYLSGYLGGNGNLSQTMQKITPRMLAQHTSGLPTPSGSPQDGVGLFQTNPSAPPPQLQNFWRTHNGPAPGSCWRYSDMGFITLGFTTVAAYGCAAGGNPAPPQAYSAVLQSQITGPLNMSDTMTIVPAGAPVARAYPDGGQMVSASAASDLKSSATDMHSWLQAQLGAPSGTTPLDKALASTTQSSPLSVNQCGDSQRGPANMGLAWQVMPGPPRIVWKDGLTSLGGCSCWIGMTMSGPNEEPLGIAVLANTYWTKGQPNITSPTTREWRCSKRFRPPSSGCWRIDRAVSTGPWETRYPGSMSVHAPSASDLRQEVHHAARRARIAARVLASLPTVAKDQALRVAAQAVVANTDRILAANAEDLNAARAAETPTAMIDRLALDPQRVDAIAAGLRQVAGLPDPVGEVLRGYTLPNGLALRQQRVPLGVVGMVYEGRPNVTVDAFGLALKSGNAALLRGSASAANSNAALVSVLRGALRSEDLPADAVQLLSAADRSTVTHLIQARGLVDVVIPRGGAGLIDAVVRDAQVPTIETGVGNCHVYVHDAADLEMAERILLNSKTRRPSVCNAAETLLVDASIADQALPRLIATLQAAGVTVHLEPDEAHLRREYLAMEIAVAVVDGVDEAIAHINEYGTGHTEAIVTANMAAAQRFTEGVDAAAVMVNASTSFTDGEQFGFGAEIGISTQKLHARGPMGLPELTSTKWIVWGDGQTRPA